ncbi:MAG: LysE family translocator [Actinomycetota bacterium]|nr:LysE family translocator [Actinomycetota bacterium]
MIGHFLAFAGVAVLVIVTPGQDTALTIRNTLLGGRSSGVFTALGVAAGQVTWTVATSAGIGALIVASQPAFDALKLAGSAYLVFLGAQALSGALRGRRGHDELGGGARRGTPARAFRQGLVSNLGNPKMLAFFTSLLPQFGDSFFALLGFGLLFCSMTLVWLSGYSLVVARAGDFLRRPRVRRTVEGLTGAVLVALGLRLATQHR